MHMWENHILNGILTKLTVQKNNSGFGWELEGKWTPSIAPNNISEGWLKVSFTTCVLG